MIYAGEDQSGISEAPLPWNEVSVALDGSVMSQ